MADKQTNIVANPERHIVFFEGENLAYNYATEQWSRVPAYSGLGFFGVSSKSQDVGLVRYSSGSVDFQEQLTTYDTQTATLSTGASDMNPGGRGVVTGVRPLSNGGTLTAQVGTQDAISDSANWSTATSVSSRTGVAPFRSEGRYQRVSVSASGAFNHIIGADVDFTPQGRV